MLRRTMISLAAIAAFAAPSQAATEEEIDTLFEAMRINDLIVLLRDEGLAQSADLSEQMFPERARGWARVVSGIYNVPDLTRSFRQGFGETLADDDITPLIDFFSSETGAEIVELELAARTALLDPATEEAAKEAYQVMVEADRERVEFIEAYVEANDLIELNVMGGLNSSLAFYNGLLDGGALEMSQDDMLREVWRQEDDIRSDAGEWLFAYLGLAYRPLDLDALESYVQLSESEAGADLNSAMFAGFDAVFQRVSYEVGASAAQFAEGEDL
ncbi:MAG: DUF2059 domain-containing protein [Pseudomonadota bacterium]